MATPTPTPTPPPPPPDDIYRPIYHLLPVQYFMNDPNGPSYFNGHYHLFYQYHPADGGGYWGHFVSKDLIYWTRLPPALAPDDSYDGGGCFSGSITVVDGLPIIVFTGQQASANEGQCVAFPTNVSDPLLLNWTKSVYNPIIPYPPPLGDRTEFRDPTTAWSDENGLWYLHTGCQYESQPAVLTFTSTDFRHWDFKSVLYTVDSSRSKFECPDFIRIYSQQKELVGYVVKASFLDPYNDQLGDIWLVGDFDPVAVQFIPTGDTVSVCVGPFYAAKSFIDPNTLRAIQWGWIKEEDGGAGQRGWNGMQSLPVVIGIDPTFNIPTATPIEELKALRKNHISVQQLKLTREPHYIDLIQNDEVEIQVTFIGVPVDAVGHLAITVFDNTDQYIEIGYAIETDVTKSVMYLDRTFSGTTGNPETQLIQMRFGYEQNITLSVFLDHSIIEVFGHQGRARIASRVYLPANQDRGTISVWSSLRSAISCNVDVWGLNTIWKS